jgi:hypothetical protein
LNCQITTLSGKPCSRKATDEGRWCYQHAGPLKFLSPLLSHECVPGGDRWLRREPFGDVIGVLELGERAARWRWDEWHQAHDHFEWLVANLEAAARDKEWRRAAAIRDAHHDEINADWSFASQHGYQWAHIVGGDVRHLANRIRLRRGIQTTQQIGDTVCSGYLTVERSQRSDCLRACIRCIELHHRQQAI